MTNKTERYYVVSESELAEVVRTTAEAVVTKYTCGVLKQSEIDRAEAACRAREVESIGGGMYQLTDWDFTIGDEE